MSVWRLVDININIKNVPDDNVAPRRKRSSVILAGRNFKIGTMDGSGK
jgi:hypothetical protein